MSIFTRFLGLVCFTATYITLILCFIGSVTLLAFIIALAWQEVISIFNG